MPELPPWDDLVLVGRIARAHGLRGHVFVNPETDFIEERFAPGATFRTRSAQGHEETLTIASVRVQQGRPVVAFEGFSSIEAIERLLGLELRVPEESLRPLEDAYYEHQLVGCIVETTSGQRVGTVARVEGGTGVSLLVVEGPRGEVLIPFASAICVEIEPAARRITIDAPEGLLELNDR